VKYYSIAFSALTLLVGQQEVQLTWEIFGASVSLTVAWQRVEYKVTCLVHQSLSGLAPTYLADDINLITDSGCQSLTVVATIVSQQLTGHALSHVHITPSETRPSLLVVGGFRTIYYLASRIAPCGAGAPLFPPCPCTSSSFPPFTFPFFHWLYLFSFFVHPFPFF